MRSPEYYKTLLKGYIDLVRVCEGTDFINSADVMGDLDDEQVAELLVLAKELDEFTGPRYGE